MPKPTSASPFCRFRIWTELGGGATFMKEQLQEIEQKPTSSVRKERIGWWCLFIQVACPFVAAASL